MSTLKDKTITSTYDQLIKRADTYSATGSRLELMDDSGVSVNSSVYLDITNQRVGLGVASPGVALDVLTGDSGYIQTRAADNGVSAKLGANSDGSGALILNDESAAQKILITGKDNTNHYLNNGGSLIIGTNSITDSEALLELYKSDSGAAAGPVLYLTRESGSVSVGDILGKIVFKSKEDGGLGTETMAYMQTKVLDDTNANEDAYLEFGSQVAGSGVKSMTVGYNGAVSIGTLVPDEIGLTIASTTGGFLTLGRAEDPSTSGEGMGAINFDVTEDSGANWATGAQIKAVVHDTWNYNAAHGSQIIFSTTDAGTTGLDERMCIYHNGYVGIGATAPATLLEVKSATGANSTIRINTTDADNATSNAILELSENSNVKWQIYNDGDDTDKLKFSDLGSAVNMVIQQDGNVGIGATAPDKLLHISSTSDAELHIEGGSDGSGNAYLLLDAGGDSDDSKVIFQKNGVSIGSIDYDHNSTETSALMKFNLNVAGSADPQMAIKADGNVGIGTSAPDTALDIGGSAEGRSISWGGTSGANNYATIGTTYSSGDLVLLAGAKPSTAANKLVYSFTGTYPVSGMGFDRSTGDIGFISEASASHTKDADFDTNAAMVDRTDLKMIILNSGNVGIGTNAPSEQLEISAQDAHAHLSLKRTDGSNAIADDEVLGRISFKGVDDALDVGAFIQARAAGDWVGNDEQGADIEFYVQSDGAADTLGSYAMVIADNGRIGIGGVPYNRLDVHNNHATDIVARLYCDNTGNSTKILTLQNKHGGNPTTGNLYVDFQDQGGSLDTIRGDGSGGIETTMAIASDSRIKKDITNLSGGLSKINALRPVSYKYTDDYLSGNMQYTNAKDWWKDVTVGFIAQEFEAQIPGNVKTSTETVTGNITYDGKSYKDGDNIEVKKIDTSRDQVFLAYLVAAIQELSAKVTALESK